MRKLKIKLTRFTYSPTFTNDDRSPMSFHFIQILLILGPRRSEASTLKYHNVTQYRYTANGNEARQLPLSNNRGNNAFSRAGNQCLSHHRMWGRGPVRWNLLKNRSLGQGLKKRETGPVIIGWIRERFRYFIFSSPSAKKGRFLSGEMDPFFRRDLIASFISRCR